MASTGHLSSLTANNKILNEMSEELRILEFAQNINTIITIMISNSMHHSALNQENNVHTSHQSYIGVWIWNLEGHIKTSYLPGNTILQSVPQQSHSHSHSVAEVPINNQQTIFLVTQKVWTGNHAKKLTKRKEFFKDQRNQIWV